MGEREDTWGLDSGALFVRYRPLALRVAAGVVQGPELAEDLVQEAFRAVHERRGGFESLVHARNYLLRTVRNLAVDALRSPSRRGSPLPENEELAAVTGDPLLQLEESEERERDSARLGAVDAHLSSLRPAEEAAVRMRYGEGLRYRDMAARTGLSVSTLQGQVETALEKIRRRIGKEEGRP